MASLTVAAAESLTGGLVCARLVRAAGASAAVRGGVVAYHPEVKSGLLDVPAALLRTHGAVHPDVAIAMATGVRRRLGADVGLATTGVAGPGPSEGHPPGTAYIAVDGGVLGQYTRRLVLAGTRGMVREAVADSAIALCLSLVDWEPGATGVAAREQSPP